MKELRCLSAVWLQNKAMTAQFEILEVACQLSMQLMAPKGLNWNPKLGLSIEKATVYDIEQNSCAPLSHEQHLDPLHLEKDNHIFHMNASNQIKKFNHYLHQQSPTVIFSAFKC